MPAAVPARRVRAALMLAPLSIALTGCAQHAQVQRLAAPGGGVDALLESSQLGGDLDYDIRVVPSGAPALAGAVALRFSGVLHHGSSPGVQMQWLQPGLLLVRFEDSRSRELTQPPVVVAGHAVRIELQQGTLE
jgi:hypothetical protein